MQTFYLFRHGLATKSKFGYGRAIKSANILPEGIPAIKRLGAYLEEQKIEYAVCSPYPRCIQTAEIITPFITKEFVVDERVQEFVLSGKEPFDSFIARVQSFINEMSKSSHQYIAVCTHGAVIGILTQLLLGKKVFKKSAKEFPLTGVVTIITGESIERVDFNK